MEQAHKTQQTKLKHLTLELIPSFLPDLHIPTARKAVLIAAIKQKTWVVKQNSSSIKQALLILLRID